MAISIPKWAKYLAMWFVIFIFTAITLKLDNWATGTALIIALMSSVLSLIAIIVLVELMYAFNLSTVTALKGVSGVSATIGYTLAQIGNALIVGVITFTFTLLSAMYANGAGFTTANFYVALVPALIALVTVIATQLNIPLPTTTLKK